MAGWQRRGERGHAPSLLTLPRCRVNLRPIQGVDEGVGGEEGEGGEMGREGVEYEHNQEDNLGTGKDTGSNRQDQLSGAELDGGSAAGVTAMEIE